MSIGEFFLVLLVALVVLGPKQLPELLGYLSHFWKKLQSLQRQWHDFWREQEKSLTLKNNEAKAESADSQYQSLESERILKD